MTLVRGMTLMKGAVLLMASTVLMALALTSAQAQQVPPKSAESSKSGESPKPAVPPKPAEPHVPLRNLNEMIEKARADLAMRLGGAVAEIKVAGWKSVHLPARVLHCDVAKGDEGEATVPGYRIVLVYKARDYTYNSDTQTVTACPRIEAS